jgi:hypothetical protein
MKRIIILIAALYAPTSLAEKCKRANIDLCPDLTGATITFEKVSYQNFLDVCKDKHAIACAQLNVTAKTCTIRYWVKRLRPSDEIHEINHCNGWFHQNNTTNTWIDYKSFIGKEESK